MLKEFTEKDIEEGEKFMQMYLQLNEVEKAMATSYLSALRDKEVSDSTKKAS